MKKIGALLLAIGAVLTILLTLNFSYNRNEGDSKKGTFQITQRNKNMPWAPVIGASIMFIGGGMYLFGANKRLSHSEIN